MAFGIEFGDVQCFDFFDGDAFGQFVDFFLWIYAFHGRPVAAVFEEVLGPVDEVGEFGKGAAGDDVGAAVGGGFYAAADDADVFKAEFDDGLLQKGGFLVLASRRVMSRSGRQMAVGMPGCPPPEPTSSMVWACSI